MTDFSKHLQLGVSFEGALFFVVLKGNQEEQTTICWGPPKKTHPSTAVFQKIPIRLLNMLRLRGSGALHRRGHAPGPVLSRWTMQVFGGARTAQRFSIPPKLSGKVLFAGALHVQTLANSRGSSTRPLSGPSDLVKAQHNPGCSIGSACLGRWF